MGILLVTSMESFLQLIGVLIIFVFVLLATYLTTRWMASFQRGRTVNKNLKVIETIMVGNNKMISIVAAGEKYLVVSIGKDEVHLLTELRAEQMKELPVDAPAVSPQESFQEILSKLKDKPNVTLFDYDLTLDQYRFHKLWKSRKKILNKTEREIFTRDYGSKIDLLNLQWIYRAKKYYQMEPVDIYNLLVPIHFKLSTQLVKELVEAPSAEDFLNVLQKTSYARHYHSLEHLTIEMMYGQCLKQLYIADAKRNPYSIATVNSYLFKKEEELERLTTAIECVRYGLTPGETLAHCGITGGTI